MFLSTVFSFGLFLFNNNAHANSETYKEALLNQNTRGLYEVALGKKCVDGLLNLYQNSEDASSKYIQSTAKNVSDYTKKLPKGYPFYHYTNDYFLINNFFPENVDRKYVQQLLQDPSSSFNYSSFLSTRRQPDARGPKLTMHGRGNMENTVFYVASNPYTSSIYGKNLLTFWMSDSTKIYPFNLLKKPDFKKIIKYDNKFSNFLDSCSSGVILIILEESGVDLVDYYYGANPNAGWFYLISTKNIISSDGLKMYAQGFSGVTGFNNNKVIKDEYLRTNEYLRQKSRDNEIIFDSSAPSKAIYRHWIWVLDSNSKQLEGAKSGKWIIDDIPNEKIDEVWGVIQKEVAKGNLGPSAKVSTMYFASKYPTRTIIVYTYDWTDKEDVMRIRARLRQIGFENKLYYKTNEMSRKGIYGEDEKKLAPYYE